MPTSNRLGFPHSLTSDSVTSRTAVYGPVRTVVWQGSVGDRRPYADLVAKGLLIHRKRHLACYRIVRHCETIPAFTKSVPLISSSAPISGYSE